MSEPTNSPAKPAPLETIKKLLWPALILGLIVFFGAPWLAEDASKVSDSANRVLLGILWAGVGLCVNWVIVRVIDVTIWKLLEMRLGAPIPRLLKDIVAACVFVVIGIIILKAKFQVPVTGIWATSGVLGIVLGFALQSMIADLFYGIAINVDQPFKIGQWVKMHARGIEPMIGCVTEISWRATRLRTIENTVIVVPNSQISTMVLVNLSEPDPKSRFDLIFTLEFGVPAERALRVLDAGAKAASGILTDPPPKVRVNKICERGVEYKVRYWLEPAETSPSKGRHAIITSILRHLHQAGLSLAYEKQDVYVARMPSRQLDRMADRSTIIKRIEIFSTLQEAEIDNLAGRLKERRFAPEQAIVKQGDAGDSMYVLLEGLLDVRTDLENGQKHVKVKNIEPGEFFGEMSLLTGEPRTATVMAVTDTIVYEIGKDDLNALLIQRPEMAIQISEIVARRRQGLAALEKLSPEEKVVAQQSFANQILDRMKNVFGCLRSFRTRANGLSSN